MMGDQRRAERELHRLRRELDEAWWNEEPLEHIEQLEHQIQAHTIHRENQPTTCRN